MRRSSRRAGSFSLIQLRASSQSDPIHSNPSLLQSLGRVWELVETELSQQWLQGERKACLMPNHNLMPRELLVESTAGGLSIQYKTMNTVYLCVPLFVCHREEEASRNLPPVRNR